MTNVFCNSLLREGRISLLIRGGFFLLSMHSHAGAWERGNVGMTDVFCKLSFLGLVSVTKSSSDEVTNELSVLVK